MKRTIVLGVNITNRVQDALAVQDLFTKFGCSIRTRLGLHEVVDNHCAPGGLILLELSGDPIEASKLETELLAIDGVEVQKMIFSE